MSDGAEEAYPLSDLALARRLERTEARSNAAFIEARARLQPESGAEWIEVAGAYAMYEGAGSPLTQTFGLGLFDAVMDAEMEALEEFFLQRGAPVFHEVSPLADLELLALLSQRGYQPVEFTSVMFRPIRRDLRLPAASNERIRTRIIEPGEEKLWAQTAARGWSESAELTDFILEMGEISAHATNALCFLAELEGEPVAAGSLNLWEGVALLAGASTIPGARKQGAQRALLESRLRYAAQQGCDLAMMGAHPGSASQRNAERQGFRIAYTRIKWQLRATAA
ncbi:MAG: GNAT family N-acetyltransferase [Gemmatimonadetes bacterium]|nr:GNAT family N-acetyltransferase [Gemmatimonadota bacterium]